MLVLTPEFLPKPGCTPSPISALHHICHKFLICSPRTDPPTLLCRDPSSPATPPCRVKPQPGPLHTPSPGFRPSPSETPALGLGEQFRLEHCS